MSACINHQALGETQYPKFTSSKKLFNREHLGLLQWKHSDTMTVYIGDCCHLVAKGMNHTFLMEMKIGEVHSLIFRFLSSLKSALVLIISYPTLTYLSYIIFFYCVGYFNIDISSTYQSIKNGRLNVVYETSSFLFFFFLNVSFCCRE